MCAARILVLADSGLADAIGEGLAAHAFRIDATAALDAALALARGIGFSAAIVDHAALGPRPAAALRRISAALGAPLCLLASAKLRVPPSVACRLAKPVRLQVLAAAVRDLVRTKSPAPSSRSGAAKRLEPVGSNLAFDASARRLVDRRTAAETQLTETETRLLAALVQSAGRAVLREDLLRAVWGYNSMVTTRTLETHIYRVRLKLKSGADRATLLQTVPGGYRLALRGKEMRR